VVGAMLVHLATVIALRVLVPVLGLLVPARARLDQAPPDQVQALLGLARAQPDNLNLIQACPVFDA
jgi:hypothetical protein